MTDNELQRNMTDGEQAEEMKELDEGRLDDVDGGVKIVVVKSPKVVKPISGLFSGGNLAEDSIQAGSGKIRVFDEIE